MDFVQVGRDRFDIGTLTVASQYGQMPKTVYCGVIRYCTGAALGPAVELLIVGKICLDLSGLGVEHDFAT